VSGGYSKAKGRGGNKGHLGLPKEVIEHDNFMKLSPHGNKLLIDIGQQYLGKNNGDLCATWSFMVARGWKSRDTLNDALRELEYYGLIVQTQMGGLNRPSLYALGWNRIDKAHKDSEWTVGDRASNWKQSKRKFVTPSSKRKRKKTQDRLACQSDTNSGTVVTKLKVIK
jgi:hypothetical protein